MFVHSLKLLTLAFLFAVVAPVAFAQEPVPPVSPERVCHPAAQLFAGLEAIGEGPAIVGVGPRGSTGILARNPETTSWTFVLVSPEGCLIFSIGGDHSASVEKKPGRPS
jgi:hypothetical protein